MSEFLLLLDGMSEFFSLFNRIFLEDLLNLIGDFVLDFRSSMSEFLLLLLDVIWLEHFF